MENENHVDLLNSVHDFPGPYTFKVIGRAEDEFVERSVLAVRESLEWEFDPPFETRETKGGRHVAVTFQLQMETAEAVLAVYDGLKQTEGVVLLL